MSVLGGCYRCATRRTLGVPVCVLCLGILCSVSCIHKFYCRNEHSRHCGQAAVSAGMYPLPTLLEMLSSTRKCREAMTVPLHVHRDKRILLQQRERVSTQNH
jgi:hypothetical protein